MKNATTDSGYCFVYLFCVFFVTGGQNRQHCLDSQKQPLNQFTQVGLSATFEWGDQTTHQSNSTFTLPSSSGKTKANLNMDQFIDLTTAFITTHLTPLNDQQQIWTGSQGALLYH